MEKNGKMLPKHRCYGAGSTYFVSMTTYNSSNNGLDKATDLRLGIMPMLFQRLDSFLIWQFLITLSFSINCLLNTLFFQIWEVKNHKMGMSEYFVNNTDKKRERTKK